MIIVAPGASVYQLSGRKALQRMDERKDQEFTSSVIERLRSTEGPQVVPAGAIPPDVYDAGWQGRPTNDAVIIKERRRHYIDRHGDELDLDTHEPMLVDAIRSPQEVHRNSSDPQMAIIYQKLPGDDEHFLRIALWISDDDTGGRKNSVHSMRIARRKELLDGRDAGRKVWP